MKAVYALHFCLLVLLSDTALCQSITVSGGQGSIIVSGSAVDRSGLPHSTPTQQETITTVPVPAIPPSQPAATQPTVAASPEKRTETITERWLVSESWCPHCPSAASQFKSSGGSADHILTIAEASRRHGKTVTRVPFEYTTTTQQTVTETPSATSPIDYCPVPPSAPAVAQQKVSMSHSEMVALHNRLHGGGSWTWPGDLETHLNTRHGVSTTRTVNTTTATSTPSPTTPVKVQRAASCPTGTCPAPQYTYRKLRRSKR